jgi:hypothetical protein
MKGKLIWSVFWALVGAFVIVLGMFRLARGLIPFGFISATVVFALLDVVLMFLIVKTKVGGILKKFLLLTGASALGMPLSVILHNVVSGLFDIEEPGLLHYGHPCLPDRLCGWCSGYHSDYH